MSNMYCSKCGSPLSADSAFCPNCGGAVNRAKLAMPVADAGYAYMPMPANPEKSGSKVTVVILTVILAILAFLCFVQFVANQGLRAKNTSLEQEINTVIAERDAVQEQLAKSLKSDEITSWLKKHGSEYNAVKQYRAATNVVVVRVGETYDLEVTYVGERYMWTHRTTGNCECEWDSGWTDYKSHLKITGISAGTSEILFSLGDKDGADPHETFRVLVIVVP